MTHTYAIVLALVLAAACTSQALRLPPMPAGSAAKLARASRASGPVVAQPALTGLTAAGDHVRSFSWSIAYAADESDIVDDQENHNLHYTIKVTRDHGSISAARVAGYFSIFNPNAAPLALSSVSAELSDRKNTYSCSVSMASSLVLAAETRVEVHYECNLGSISPEGLTLVAALAWPKQKVDGVAVAAGSDKAQLNIAYSHMSETLVDDCVTVTDTYAGDLIHQVCESDIYHLTRPVHVPAGACNTFRSTAIYTTNDFGRADAAFASVSVCVSAPLAVAAESPSAAPVGVSGTAIIRNPNTWQAVTADVDVALEGASCKVADAGITLAAGAAMRVAYTCAYAAGVKPASGEKVSVVVSWDDAEAYTEEAEAQAHAEIVVRSPAMQTVEAPTQVLPIAAASAPASACITRPEGPAVTIDAATQGECRSALMEASI